MAALLVVATVAFLSQLAGASLMDTVDSAFDFDATLKKVSVCEGTSYKTHWTNCSYSRSSPETVLLSMDMIVGEVVPNTHAYSVEIVIENQPDENAGERTPVAVFTWGDICKELVNEKNEAVQKVLQKVDGDMKCPIQEGVYRAVGVEMDVDDLKPLLREGLMFFTVTQILEAKPFACHVIEFQVSFD